MFSVRQLARFRQLNGSSSQNTKFLILFRICRVEVNLIHALVHAVRAVMLGGVELTPPTSQKTLRWQSETKMKTGKEIHIHIYIKREEKGERGE